MATLRLGLEDKAILENVDSERRGKLDVLWSVNNLRKLKENQQRLFQIKLTTVQDCYYCSRRIYSTHNFLTPEFCLVFFHGASSGSYGRGPCTGGSSSSSSALKQLKYGKCLDNLAAIGQQ